LWAKKPTENTAAAESTANTKTEGNVAEPDPVPTIAPNVLIVGALDKSLINDGVRKSMPDIRTCYQQELPNTPDLAGNVRMKFVIAIDGRVHSASVKEGDLNSPPVGMYPKRADKNDFSCTQRRWYCQLSLCV